MPAKPRFRTLKRVVGVLFLGFIAIQFIRPDLKNHPATAEAQFPDDVKQILKHSCYDCHSTEGKLAWFDLPVPAYWLVVHDIREARRHVNFSELGKLPIGQQKAALYEGLFQIRFGAMPLPAYRRLHHGTAITPEQIAVLKNYLADSKSIAPATATEIDAADAQYKNWLPSGNNLAASVAPAPNGIEFLPDYKNWTPISSSNRFDNHTSRQILGNDVAIKALAQNHLDPWPDGSAFAKVAWLQQSDENGVIRPGSFYQVEFMIRDARKYAATLGWGWARWRGTDLKPYGKDAKFTAECIGCHKPLHGANYLFTMPIPTNVQKGHAEGGVSWTINDVPIVWAEPNDGAALTGTLPANPLAWHMISSEIDKPNATMATLYGNDTAVNYARTHADHNYPPGSVLSLVAWKQKEDERWFGANIPARAISVEFVTVENGAENKPAYSYELYEGVPLKMSSLEKQSAPKGRAAYLLSARAAVLP
jgi:hypothetical protein